MKKTCILIRFDDICPTMNWEQWAKACALLDAYGKKPLIGVIPDCKDPDLQINEAKENFWEYVRELQAQGYKIAMHGHQHIFISQHKGMVNNRVGSEFAGLSYEKQLEKILAGQKILKEHGIETDVFFAPAHSYDLNTLRALKKAGFKYITDGKSEKPVEREGILCIPCRFGGCPKIKDSGYYTAVFHAHEWVRPDKAQGYKQLATVLKNHTNEIVTFDEYAERTVGNYTLECMKERMYVTYEYTVKTKIMKLKHNLKLFLTRQKK